MLVLAHISDLHLDGTARATERARRVRDRLWELPDRPDALLVTGDIADHGTESEYEEAARLLGLRDGSAPFPVLTCPGNHDSRAPYRKALLGQPGADGPVNSAHVLDGGAVLMCDSSIPGHDDGELDTETCAWIESTLDGLDGGLPVLLAFHHPPVPLHLPLPDSYPLRAPERLAALLARRPEVAGLITGHAHTPAATTFAGRPVLVGPGVTWTLRLPWEGGQVADRDAPVGLAFHVLDDEGRLTSHFRVVT
ncbi:metallophosphoesterase [Streptomyces griseoloalbus]|uniref:3',5'-cyclic AMP phosphodiesterase CpdA n=1 Tax=Streptomyces griseoloalbus TaxID=67303 RepID=A0A7W8F8R6_9ACTN|nr:metallophosphoesterase [Streptomyces albaduncus]MBB5124636.1 3',5'-cyclic AMP phosphodiesterase CpdA [Streptomyces albaduncus]GGV72399.1 3',5'-cyclic adenosine monophosphate phosphodiesterase CpdA [Streptomyces griseoloalbus]GGW38343.1 3',5'-cyclic adenosine monophosphate phosphodiesterase CpdA [Streptomyces albaduncus]